MNRRGRAGSELLAPAEVRLPCGTCAICEVRTLHPKIPVYLRENAPERDYSLCGQTQALETASIQYKIGMAEGDTVNSSNLNFISPRIRVMKKHASMLHIPGVFWSFHSGSLPGYGVTVEASA